MILRILFSCLLGVFAIHSCGWAEEEEQSRPLLGTIVTVKVCDPFADGRVAQVFDKVWARLEEINRRLHPYDVGSEIVRINQAAGALVDVTDDVYRLLRAAKGYVQETRGAFDIAVGPLSDLWKEAERRDVFPSTGDVRGVLPLVDTDKVDLLPTGQVRLRQAGMRIDVSGMAQGYAADEAARILRQTGFRDFLLDTGGEIYAAGLNCRQQSWRVGVSDPRAPRAMEAVLSVRDAAVSTSGDYERSFEIRGQRWSHIINPITGYPLTGVAGVTVIAPTATEADVLSTAVSVLGPRHGLRLIASKGRGYEAMILLRDANGGLERSETEGYKRYLSR
ncbi:MAG: FAD:protein FMN transferase [Elusimicrobia bacterium]|nr:FAD:protein FMN transferase [Elusimicrobiota bacterium]